MDGASLRRIRPVLFEERTDKKFKTFCALGNCNHGRLYSTTVCWVAARMRSAAAKESPKRRPFCIPRLPNLFFLEKEKRKKKKIK